MPRRTWTDDDLRAALAGARTMSEVVQRLRLAHGGASYTTVRTRMEQLELDPPVRREEKRTPAGTSWRRSFTEGDLERAVARSSSLKGVFDDLGLEVGGSQWATIRQLIVDRGSPTAHWRRPLDSGPRDTGEVARFRTALAAADLGAIVTAARSRADIIRALGFEPRPSLYRVLRPHLERSGLCLDHFEASHARMQEAPPRPRRPLAELLVADRHVSTHTLKLRLIEEGVLEPVCSGCTLREWRGGPIPLQLDHIDGDRTNNVVDNLRLLCPNCHALTDTYCGRNIGRR